MTESPYGAHTPSRWVSFKMSILMNCLAHAGPNIFLYQDDVPKYYVVGCWGSEKAGPNKIVLTTQHSRWGGVGELNEGTFL